MNCSKPGMERSTWAYNFTRWWFCTFFESHWKITLSWTSAYFFENTPFFDGNYFKIICMLISNQAFSFNETSHLAKKSWNICTIGFAFQMLNRQSNLSWILLMNWILNERICYGFDFFLQRWNVTCSPFKPFIKTCWQHFCVGVGW